MTKVRTKINEWNKELTLLLLTIIIGLIGYFAVSTINRFDKAIDSINAYNIEDQKREAEQNIRIANNKLRIEFIEVWKNNNKSNGRY